MKKVIIIIEILLTICLITGNIYYFKKYRNSQNRLLDFLNNQEYDAYITEKEIAANDILSNISEINTIEEAKNISSSISSNIESITNNISQKNDELTSLTSQKKELEKKYSNLKNKHLQETTVLINNVPTLNQYSLGYPTGCESAALTILLNYWGTNVSISEVARILKKGDKPYWENGIQYGGNPYIEFIGNPQDEHSYGVYDEPIIDVANTLKSGIISAKGSNLNTILKIIDQGRPVIVWNSMNLSSTYVSNSWIYKPTGEKINWLHNLHAIVIVGYNDEQIITSDSLTGTIRYFNRSTFENRYNAFGKRALYY